MATRGRDRKAAKFKNDICYSCGTTNHLENEDIPGKQYGVTAQTGGLLVPVCHPCNDSWHDDQEFFRLRILMHAGSQPGAGHIKVRELARLRGGAEKRRSQLERYATERSKEYVVGGRILNGLTNSDFYQIENVLRHWAAGIHYAKRSAMAAAPGSVFHKIEHPDVFTKLNLPPMPSGKWIANDGHEFGRWWFLPGKDPTESITVFNLLFGESLWYLVRFPRLTQNE